MGFIVFTFVAIFFLIASGGLLLFYREAMLKRMSEVVTPQARQGALLSTIQQTGSSFGEMVEHLERVLPRTQAEASVVQQRLIRAGYRKDSAVNLFYGAKVFVPLALALIVFATHNSSFFMYAIALGLGFLSPDFWLDRRIK